MSLMAGTIEVRRPRVRGLESRFESRILPLFKRRTEAVGDLLPELYLHGLAEGDFDLALRGLLGEGAPLSASSVARLKSKWQAEYEAWTSRPLDDLEVVYLWVDGIYVKAGLEKGCEEAGRLLDHDWNRMVTFYDFPKEHWKHLRTSNVVESPFATVRLRTTAAKRYKKVENGTAVLWKTLLVAEKRFRKLDAPELLSEVAEGAVYENGIRKKSEVKDIAVGTGKRNNGAVRAEGHEKVLVGCP